MSKIRLLKMGSYWTSKVGGSRQLCQFWYGLGNGKIRCRRLKTTDIEVAKRLVAALLSNDVQNDRIIPRPCR